MIRIHTFGGFTVRGEGDEPIAGAAAQPRRMALLALLVRAGDQVAPGQVLVRYSGEP